MIINLLDNDQEITEVRVLYQKANCYLEPVLRCMMEDAAEIANAAIEKIMEEKVK